ncbi:snRNA-activating protein complex subunit 1-like isoform X2 [Haliotis asinina]|uniref:snRNA-activating protein complex subunit 1-like isoform X2 n=1 Tax=Haliotis asinina TaxID=109174 RepID=UPI0035321AE2
MKFSYLYAGRKNDRECREFYEEVNHIALSFHLLPYDFQVRTGGLYILYGLYFTQPCIPKIPVYIRTKDKIQADKGGDSDSLTRDNLRVEDSVSTVFTPDILQQLRAIHMQYQQIKLGIAGPNALRPDRSLDVVEDEIMHSIDNRLLQHKQRLEKVRNAKRGRLGKLRDEDSGDGESSDNPDDTPVPMSGQARVKAQAYAQQAQQSKARRHRTVITLDASESSPEKPIRKRHMKIKSDKGDEDEDVFESQLTSPTEESSDQLLSPVEYLSMPTLDMDVTNTSGPTAESDVTQIKDGPSKSCPSEKGPSTSKPTQSKASTGSLEAGTDCSISGTTPKLSKTSSKKSKKTPTKSAHATTSTAKAKVTPKAKSVKPKGKGGVAVQQKVKKRRHQSGAGEEEADEAPALKVGKSPPSKTSPKKEPFSPKIVYKPL